MRKTTVYFPDDLDRELKAKAQRSGVPAAELIRAAVRRSLDEEPRPMPRSIGIVAVEGTAAREDEAELARAWRRKWAEHSRLEPPHRRDDHA